MYKIVQIIWWRYFVYKPMVNDIATIINLQNRGIYNKAIYNKAVCSEAVCNK